MNMNRMSLKSAINMLGAAITQSNFPSYIPFQWERGKETFADRLDTKKKSEH